MAHTTASSIYSAAEDVPLILAPQFSALKSITLSQDFNLDLPQVASIRIKNHDFQLERQIIAESERYKQENATLTQLRAQKLQALQEERIRKQKEEARKIAPGFLDTNLRILTPVPVNNTQRKTSQQAESGNNIINVSENVIDEQKVHVRSASDDMVLHGKMKSKEEGDETKPVKSFYSEFEDPPRKPWEQSNIIQDDISIFIRSPISSNEANNLVANGGVTGSSNFLGTSANHDMMVTNQNHPRSFHASPLLQPSVGAPLPSQLSNQTFAPDLLSNNLANLQISQNTPLNIHNNTTPPVKSYSAPSSSQERRPLLQPYSTPPIPPKEVLPTSSSSPKNEEHDSDDNSDLINKFINMGFTKEQAIDALVRHDYDLQKATNYLLDLQ
ncbi:hypothetical protein RhiirA5_408476 [Rhizophagus irregularis]|uniref:UBA domain-containing protein n=1 Tax=Rhizophagus irregularis TaxID=588596 RepID=A0A2N0Q7Z9_9GLOM|nr:hypothetical protein RhiirA5_408476 [Rhizophagus irregularis]PKC75579.1 hypothetical protein RhiirA1_448631 [Rhizophagus irregularis]